MKHEKVSKAVEDICNLGCTIVNEIIHDLEHGDEVKQAQQLDNEERNRLLDELKAIMDVYDKK